jgi:hypothetical protein
MTTRKELAEELLKQGKTYSEIGKELNPAKPLSRQRIHQLLTGYKSPSYRRIKENQAA